VVVVDDESIARQRTSRLVSAMPNVELLAACDGAEALLTCLREQEVDLVLLDIRMPGLDGIELAAMLGEDGPSIVYVSAYREHAIDAFDVGAVDYVLKPVEPKRLQRAVERARAAREERATPPPARLAVHHAGDVLLLDPATITHCSFDGTLVSIHRAEQAPLLSERSLTELEGALPPGFVRVHRRHLIALAHVARLEPTPSGGYRAVMANGDGVSVSRQAARRLRRQLDIR
jgi:two-component system LytT family response regulator